jgi:hypothetical protein
MSEKGCSDSAAGLARVHYDREAVDVLHCRQRHRFEEGVSDDLVTVHRNNITATGAQLAYLLHERVQEQFIRARYEPAGCLRDLDLSFPECGGVLRGRGTNLQHIGPRSA